MPVLVTSAISHFTFLYFPTLSKYTVFLLASYEGMLAIGFVWGNVSYSIFCTQKKWLLGAEYINFRYNVKTQVIFFNYVAVSQLVN